MRFKANDLETIAEKLAFVDSVGENAYETEAVAEEFLKLMTRLYPERIMERYGFEDVGQITVENIAINRKLIVSDSQPDILRASSVLLSDFREGRLGKLTLDEPV